jgi:hypothetical protein
MKQLFFGHTIDPVGAEWACGQRALRLPRRAAGNSVGHILNAAFRLLDELAHRARTQALSPHARLKIKEPQSDFPLCLCTIVANLPLCLRTPRASFPRRVPLAPLFALTTILEVHSIFNSNKQYIF